MTTPCKAFRKSDFQPCQKHARNGHHTCYSHRNFYTKPYWKNLFCSLDSPYLPVGLDYSQTSTLGRIEAAVVYALENNLVVLTQEDCASLPCPSPREFHLQQRSAVDLWTLLVRSGKVDPTWNVPLTKFAIFTFARMRLPSLLDIAPSLDKRLGAFLTHEKVEAHKFLENVLGYLFLLLRTRHFSEDVKKEAFRFVIREFTEHPSFKESLFMQGSALTEQLQKIPVDLLSEEWKTTLRTLIVNEVMPKRQEVKTFHHSYVEIFKEELVMKVFHPNRVEKWLEEGGFELLDMMF